MDILRGVLLGAAYAFYFSVIGVKLVRALRLSLAIKRRNTVVCSAEITDIKLRRLTSVKSAEAQYSIGGHKYTGQMVGMFNGKISIGQTLSVIVNPDNPEVFALNESQPRQASATYAVLAALPVLFVGVIILAVTFL
ncbi:MAG: DUF3592 domain-containing protein [Oscillospiraceae bacterium]|nr:DUF3592 domain-containing protein [Oscillospiraceae bacterium]